MQQLSLLNENFDEKRIELYEAGQYLHKAEELIRIIEKELQVLCKHPPSEQLRENMCHSSKGKPRITCRLCNKDLTKRYYRG